MQNIYDLVVVGGGPCGIATVVEAKRNGLHNVLLLEKGDNHSQTIRKFYKDNKRVDKEYKGQDSTIHGVVAFEDGTKESTLDFFDKLLDEEKIKAIFNSEVESIKKDGDLLNVTTANATFKAKSVMISIGKMGRPNKPDYKIPPSLNQVINFNLDNCTKGEKVLVVGGGNSAVEYAIELCLYNKTTIAYRRDDFSRVNETNKDALWELEKHKKIKVRLNHDITELENESGRVRVHYSNGKIRVYDRVVYAIGGSSPVDFLQKCQIAMDEKGNPIVDEKYQSNIPSLYIGGDIVLKNGGSIVAALNHAHVVVKDIIAKRG
ncbi:NAD(P)-binding domain-containing protein [Campylobacter sp. RM9344]|uniref:NAD(P)-binding domain-containing protein n=1 Tax=Campylobacter californiensis TaxID=1032243 RepID=A0AAW3ZUS7_9BACT|nr:MULTISPECIES: NAD(P)-binding domain-containing protein [unclassified Campylobacter]MBE2983747.1 NAD(P)-binding domain-containing protein [Campylobacter sp. RM6883]MBE2985689.1 NAD(P)-binding domain-containing protein [Campylobacter sp. RM12919]MBE2987282.1 NAD(P)-binding domain-containing protein [Campylobacter sp. RM12920]MBE2994286.1 NAD(P)-binding domain-containing protein [Campylobacter sp. RM6913]MBE3022699.1 NAD(P)-binding domain-containing protein [Campylobacter sp. 7477a]MBE3028594